MMLSRTLHTIMVNIREICNLKRSEFWNVSGPAWQKIVVCIVCDGIDPCDKGVLDVLGTIGLYQDGIMKKDVDGVETVAHIFEYTSQLSVTAAQQLIRPRDDSADTIPPVQLMLCLKQKNSKKINSHRWIFNAFGRLLNPEVVVCIDVGVRLEPRAILMLWEQFFNDKDVGGCCGETHVMLGKNNRQLLNPLVAAQHFEYKISSILDKPLESSFGYMTVLPGSFSAYRFHAVMGQPLMKYYNGDSTLSKKLGSKGIVAMGSKWHLTYVKAAQAEVDVPTNMVDFFTQRRRWLNGAFAATVYSLIHFHRIWKSGHNVARLTVFHVQVLYNVVSLSLSWFGIAGFLLTMFITTDITGSPPEGSNFRPFPFGKATPIFNAVIQSIYTATIVMQFIMALGGQVKSHVWSYVASFFFFAIIQLYFFLNVLYLMIRIFMSDRQDGTGSDYGYVQTFYSSVGSLTVLVACGSIFGVYYAASFLSLDPWHMFTSYPQYLFVASSYTNILNVYAFSNWHDVSWGVKQGMTEAVDPLPSISSQKVTRAGTDLVIEEIDRTQEDIDSQFEALVKRALRPHMPLKLGPQRPTIEESFKIFRTRLIIVYLFSNFMLCIFVMNDSFDSLKFLGNSYQHKVWFFRIFLWATSGTFIKINELLEDELGNDGV
ncbi:hypothetical protein EG329_006133 [Mollisiaceae sp. DMI_Dod_QoI]|nr:hypothetical protein EG329_006133 [Helotiales sp. DMI_Dod_QoI]